jgi:imidazoleglycerol phosphate synthase glutamine amidotransferase subunit HisH
MGWARVDELGADFYFAHSYALTGAACATAHSEDVIAEVRTGSFTGVQFHPEKSSHAGARYLQQCLSHA